MGNENKKPVLTAEQLSALPNQVEIAKAAAKQSEGLAKRKENIELGKSLSGQHPGKRIIALDAKPLKPVDYCERIADLFVNAATKELDRNVLELNTDDMVSLINRKLGSPYKTNRTFWTTPRPLKVKPKSTKPCVEKIIYRLNRLGLNVDMPEPDGGKMSLNQIRPYLIGNGMAHPWTVRMSAAVELGLSKVTVARKVFHWVDMAGRKVDATQAACLRSSTGDLIQIDSLVLFLGLTREQILAKALAASLE